MVRCTGAPSTIAADAEQRLEFRVLVHKVKYYRADNINFELMIEKSMSNTPPSPMRL